MVLPLLLEDHVQALFGADAALRPGCVGSGSGGQAVRP